MGEYEEYSARLSGYGKSAEGLAAARNTPPSATHQRGVGTPPPTNNEGTHTMSKHVFTVAVELTADDNNITKQVLDGMAERIATNITEEYGITEYDNGKPCGLMGFEGPFVTKVEVAR